VASQSDIRAALLLLALAVAGLGVRLLWSKGAPSGGVAYHATEALRPGHDSVAARAARLARPLQPGETIDLDKASAEELTRLPRIGPGLAARIVADRSQRGPFGSLERLDRVPGIGPATLEALKPYASFSAASAASAARVPSASSASSASPAGWSGEAGLLVTFNTAPADSLTHFPGIGPTRARAIVADRRNGPYRSLEDLARVPGVGPATIRRLREHARVP
jgi:competence ComEA-like helix-hairpin-helix protein